MLFDTAIPGEFFKPWEPAYMKSSFLDYFRNLIGIGFGIGVDFDTDPDPDTDKPESAE
ncbi:MAG: hypothetical protein ACLFUY_00425 [Desulfobacterales bacterium]